MYTRDKNERKQDILGHIVCSYVYSSAPVSSKTVSGLMGGRISSATVRNIMAELEEEGYIEQPHTSAGRIPTSSGYREYVKAVRAHIKFKKDEAQKLASEYDKHINTLTEVIEKTSFLISQHLHNAGVVMWPSISVFYLKHIELIKIKAETVLAILVTVTNAVKNYIIKLEKDLEKTDLERIANYINTNFEYTSLSEISEKLGSKADNSAQEEKTDFKKSARGIIDAVFQANVESEICCRGLDYVINESSFRNPDIARNLMRFLSRPYDIMNFMRQELPDGGLRIYIGEESGNEALKECSIITCGYNMNGKTAGRLGVIGPMRMDYIRALRTIRNLADVISEKLEDMNR